MMQAPLTSSNLLSITMAGTAKAGNCLSSLLHTTPPHGTHQHTYTHGSTGALKYRTLAHYGCRVCRPLIAIVIFLACAVVMCSSDITGYYGK